MATPRLHTRLSRTYNRRSSLRLAVGVAFAATGTAANTATAARGWCRSDPVVLIDGVLADIFCTAPLSALLEVTGPTEITITVPEGVKTTLILAGIGFGQGETVHFATSKELQNTEDSLDVKIEVLVPAKEDLPIGVEFAPRIIGILNPDRAEGYANSLITLSTALDDDDEILGILGHREERRKRKKGHKRRRRH